MKSKTMFKGIKGLVASGPGMTKKVYNAKVRPEQNQGAKIPQDAMKKTPHMTPAKPAGVVMPHGKVSVMSKIRSEGPIKRDAAHVVKP